MNTDSLFRPFSLKTLNIKNRIVMAPMTRSFSPGGVPTADVASYYAKRAAGEVGLTVHLLLQILTFHIFTVLRH
jgi:2,4-dienoyl-CoA reductase-like NADH-dependent reductase (Old Yellow Enzyme family)